MKSNVLRLTEFERIRIGREWSPERREIPAALADRIDRLQERLGIKAFEVGPHEIKAQQFVGTLSVSGHTIDILPKIDTPERGVVRERLAEMLGTARLVPYLEAEYAHTAGRSVTLLDMFMEVYVRRLRDEWRRGAIRSYQKEEANRAALKGKLVFPVHLRRNLLHPERFYTRADVFTSDVALSRLLKAALRVVRGSAYRERLRRDAHELLFEFAEVSDVTLSASQVDAVGVDRRQERFAPLAGLAKLFLRGLTSDAVGSDSHFALLFDMNMVFERYVGELLRRFVCPRLGLRANLQARGKHLLHEQGTNRFPLRPDVEISAGARRVGLVDTKWKALDPLQTCHGVTQADAYQMYAYGREFDSPVVVLLYPRVGTGARTLHTLSHQPPHQHRILVQTVDVAKSRVECADDLQAALVEAALVSPLPQRLEPARTGTLARLPAQP